MKKGKMVRVSVSLPADMHAELQWMAEENARSLSGQVVWMLRPLVAIQEGHRLPTRKEAAEFFASMQAATTDN